MELAREEVSEPTGYLVRPARTDAPPAVLVIHELWGLDDHIRDIADRFAAAGYLAFAPDLYAPRAAAVLPARTRALETFYENVAPEAWRDPALLDAALDAREDGDDLRETMETLRGGDTDAYLAALERCVAWLRDRAPSVGSVGFCMGGGLSGRLTTTAAPPDAAVVFYGGLPEPELHERIAAPIQGHFGEEDTRLTQWVEPFREGVARVGKRADLHVYAGAPHAFFNDTRSFYRPGAARVAWARTLSFFAAELA